MRRPSSVLRGCFRSSEGPRNSLEHELNHGQVDEGLPSAWQLFIILAEPPAPGNPVQGALHQPSSGHHSETMASGTLQHFQHAVEVFQDPLAQHLPPIGPVAPDEPQPMEPASPELEPTQQRRQPLLVSLAAVTTTAKNRPMLSTSTWRLRPLTHLPPSKPPAQWVRQPSGTDCVSAMANQGDWGACGQAVPKARR